MNARLVLLDTSALYALVDREDKRHDQVAAATRELARAGATLVIIDPIFSEAMTLLKARLGVDTAVRVGLSLRNSRMARVIEADSDDREAAWDVFNTYRDKAWSYADCACLAFMEGHQIGEALSVDRHFAQMGVTCWPGGSPIPG